MVVFTISIFLLFNLLFIYLFMSPLSSLVDTSPRLPWNGTAITSYRRGLVFPDWDVVFCDINAIFVVRVAVS